ncbi:MAG: NAD(P)/FAD-dependent oxidoreductase [Acidobacteriota bacterium]|nr:NAD(P)/FAD-dependent oxidoreductase [Acidobacteriota bacterium]MDH3530624.1 NAD(P)/FAD-dependent oxidoreductase [Acidobacteriota bacterium]
MPTSRFDVVILGAGPAGLSAALWANELGLRSKIFEAGIEAGGQLLFTFNRIENHLGTSAKNGTELRDTFLKQLSARQVEIRFDSRVSKIDPDAGIILLENGNQIAYSCLVICTGVSRRTLGIPGEKKYAGKGILCSGKREAEQAKGKTALVVGGGDAAFENALLLAEQASKVFLVHRRSQFAARKDFIDKVSEHPLIEILKDTELKSIRGSETVENVFVLNKEGKEINIPVEYVVIRIGVKPNSEFVRDFVETDERGYIIVESDCSTSERQIFAAGDVANPSSPTISTAIGMGSTAVKRICEILGC